MSRYTITIATIFVTALAFCGISEYHYIQQYETNQQQISQ